MNNANDIVKMMLDAASIPKVSVPPAGWFRRTDIQESTGCSEMTAVRMIKKMRSLKGFKSKDYIFKGKKVTFYTYEGAPLHPIWSKGASDSPTGTPTGEQTNPTISPKDFTIFDIKEWDNNHF